jgi:AraC family transcriptional regulator of adaptative response / DNA-3-methyladenine glycosylase II
MQLDRSICYRALRTRDRRFDGRFFTGVRSTGVYCRPICPARTPKRDNCTFFLHAAAAEEAGFRPCLRCRPETSPGTPAWQGTSATVSRALRLIDEGALDRGGVDQLALGVGVGARHLRRLFVEHLGAPPLAVDMTRRVHFAKQLLEETSLSITRVALSAGFNNARRFNAAFRSCFQQPPSAIRRARGATHIAGDANNGVVKLRLSYRPPLAWDALLSFLAPRAIPGVEAVVAESYRRTVAMDGIEGILSVAPDPCGDTLVLQAPLATAPRLFEVVERVRTLLDLTADPGLIEDQLLSDPELATLAVPRGLRVLGAWDRFELAVRAILGQQVSLQSATTLCGRLVETFGRRLAEPVSGADGEREAGASDSPAWVFPTAADLARVPSGRLASIGIPAARAVAIQGLARAVAEGAPVLQRAADLDTTIARLTALAGIGDWTAHYIAMRALREPDAFPAGDLGLRRALAQGDRPLTPRSLSQRSETWRPWRAYAAVRLWTALTNRMETT